MAYTTVNKSTDYFNTLLYTGTGSGGSNRQLTGVGFQPDWTWIKNRNSSQEHVLVDAVRGATKSLDSSANSAESTTSTQVGAFISDGFQLGSGSVQNRVNGNGNGLVAWNWKANGQGSSNTDGSINTTYTSVNTTAGFSISKYTGNATNGATVGHGLGAVPDMLIGKDLSDTSGWGVWHKDLTNAGYKLSLNTSDGQADDSALFGGSSRTAPTSSVFTLGSGGGLNGSNANIVYAFTSIKGYSKFGEYGGNANANGTFVYTGFKPAFIMLKRKDASTDWLMYDNKRNSSNLVNSRLAANEGNAEGSDSNGLDFLSNGFKLRTADASWNGNDGNPYYYIYMAFASNPFVATSGTKAIPVTAR